MLICGLIKEKVKTCSILVDWLTEKDGIDFDLSTCMPEHILAKVFLLTAVGFEPTPFRTGA